MTLQFNISVKPGAVGKEAAKRLGGVWETRTMTPSELAKWSFYEHQAYCHSVFDAERFKAAPQHYKMSKANEFLLYSEVVTVDIDSKDLTPEEKSRSTMEWLLSQPFVAKHCFLITPSSGNSPEKPNWHLSFKLDHRITDAVDYRRIALALHSQIGLTTDHQTAKAAQPTYGTLYKNEERHAGGYLPEDIYVNDDAAPVSVEWLDALKPAEGSRLDLVIQAQASKVRADNYAQSESANRRVEAHFKQPEPEREKVVLECLRYVLPTLNEETTYDLWVQVWMSAHHGAPTERVRDYIVDHPSVTWSDGEMGKAKFVHAFNTHVHNEGGFTVASLFYLARQAGWLATTGYEIPEGLATKIDVKRVTDWTETLDEIPARLLLESQTGSGKTQNLIHLWKRLGEPKTVVFVPSIKLATELAATLRQAGLPATLYLDIRTGRSASTTILNKAEVLVTTLQTFATKIHRGSPIMKDYGLVYVEESDQLLSQFGRGGGGMYGSHVREHEAKAGFAALRDAFQHSGVVWCVDATMSQVTYTVATSMSNQPVQYVKNTHVSRKATVRMVEDRASALHIVLKALLDGKRVVVAADTKDQAREVVETMRDIGALEGKSSLLITKETERYPEVQDFMTDVNEEAKKYDLIAYNSVMASGVSITSVRPDVVVQFCGYLTPRNNLQILNRFRDQAKVFCYYAAGENFYRNNADDIQAEAERRIDLESKIVSVPYQERTDDARLRTKAAAISIGDELLQRRAAKEFYATLLKGDGRKVIDIEAEPADEPLRHTLKGVREARKAQREAVAKDWYSVRPIDQEHPADADMDDLTVAKGTRHAEIKATLNGHVPEDEIKTEQVTQEYVDAVCSQFAGCGFFLSAFARQEAAIRRAEAYLADRSRAILTVANNATLVSVLLTIRLLYHDLEEILTPEKLEQRAGLFIQELVRQEGSYNAIISEPYHRLEEMLAKYDTKEEKATNIVKVLLNRIGLKQKSERLDRKGGETRRAYHISNLNEAKDFLRWKYTKTNDDGEVESLRLQTEIKPDVFDAEIEKRRRAAELMAKLTTEQKANVFDRMMLEPHTTFETAVLSLVEGDAWT
jgi:hypothetical protein